MAVLLVVALLSGACPVLAGVGFAFVCPLLRVTPLGPAQGTRIVTGATDACTDAVGAHARIEASR